MQVKKAPAREVIKRMRAGDSPYLRGGYSYASAALTESPADPEADDLEADRIATTLEAEVDLSDRCRRE